MSDLDSQIQFSCLLCPRELVLPLGNLILFVNKTKPWSGYTEAKYIKLKTKNQIPNFFGWHFNFFIHFWKRGTRKLFYSKKTLFLSRFLYKKLLNFHLHRGGASVWRVHSHWSLENLKLVEISKNDFNTT